MKIYIRTLGRVDNQITFNGLSDKWKEKVIFVVQEHERPLYKYDTEYLVVPSKHGLAKTRRDIALHAGNSIFAWYDDDVEMVRRDPYFKERGKKCREPFTSIDWDDWFGTSQDWLENNPELMEVGAKDTQTPPTWYSGNMSTWIENAPVYGCSVTNGQNVQKIKNEIPWPLVEQGEDTNFILSYLTRGFKNRVSQIHTFKSKLYAPGGCNTYRNIKHELSDYQKLIDTYPDFVKWGSESKTHPGSRQIKISWKKAYQKPVEKLPL